MKFKPQMLTDYAEIYNSRNLYEVQTDDVAHGSADLQQ